jgi:pyrroloquinoline quinone biosynthesis protein D
MRLAPGVRVVHDRVTGKHVLLAPERGLVLDETAGAVVALLDGTRTLDDIVDALCRERGARAPRETVRRDVSAFLDALIERRMVVP